MLDDSTLEDCCVRNVDSDGGGDGTSKATVEAIHSTVYNFHAWSDAIQDGSQSKVAPSLSFSKILQEAAA